jgi:hypothetical protein
MRKTLKVKVGGYEGPHIFASAKHNYGVARGNRIGHDPKIGCTPKQSHPFEPDARAKASKQQRKCERAA